MCVCVVIWIRYRHLTGALESDLKIDDIVFSVCSTYTCDTQVTHTHTHTCRPVDGTSMNKECAAIDAVGSMPPL